MSKGPVTAIMRQTLQAMARTGAVLLRSCADRRSYRLSHPDTRDPVLVDGQCVWRDTAQVRAMLNRGLIIGAAGRDADEGDVFALTDAGRREAAPS